MSYQRFSESQWREAAQKWANTTWAVFIIAGIIAFCGAPIIAIFPGLYGLYSIFNSFACTSNAEMCRAAGMPNRQRDEARRAQEMLEKLAKISPVDSETETHSFVEESKGDGGNVLGSIKFSDLTKASELKDLSDNEVIKDFASYLRKYPLLDSSEGNNEVRDIYSLPHGKWAILDEITSEIYVERNKHLIELMKWAALKLAHFHAGVGETPLSRYGPFEEGLAKWSKKSDEERSGYEYERFASQLAEFQIVNRFDEFSSLILKEKEGILEKLKDAHNGKGEPLFSEEENVVLIRTLFLFARAGGEITEKAIDLIVEELEGIAAPLNLVEGILEEVLAQDDKTDLLARTVVVHREMAYQTRKLIFHLCEIVFMEAYDGVNSTQEALLEILRKEWGIEED